VSTFIAKSNIPWGEGGVLAYTRGQTVEADAVKANGWQDYVVADGTKEAAEVKADITGRPVSDFETSTPAARRASASTSTQEG
jgi:hypothetical protein